jgi:hypothetical protein
MALCGGGEYGGTRAEECAAWDEDSHCLGVWLSFVQLVVVEVCVWFRSDDCGIAEWNAEAR